MAAVQNLYSFLYFLSSKVELIDVNELNPGAIQSTEQDIHNLSRSMPLDPEYCSVSSSEQDFFNLNYSIHTWITAPFNY